MLYSGVTKITDRLKTISIECKGGLNTSTDTLSYLPGECVQLQNFEAGIYGGYRRINGYAQYDSAQVSGSTGNVLGVCVYNGGPSQTSGVVACEGVNVYFSSGSGWSKLNGSSARTGAGRYMFAKYQNVNSRIVVMCDGVNYAGRWDGTTYSLINGTGAPANPQFATWWNSSLVLAGYTTGGVNSGGAQSFSISAPTTDTDFNGADGAIEIDCHDNIVGIRGFRGNLYIFCNRTILELSGTNVTNYVLTTIATGIGCVAFDSIQESNGDLTYLSADGIRTLAATMKLNDTELGTLSKPIINLANSVFSTANNNPANISSCVVRSKNQYRLFYHPTGAAQSNAEGLIGAIRPGKQMMTQFGTYISVWEWSQIIGIDPVCCDSDFTSGTELIAFGGSDGYVYQMESGNSFNGQPVSAICTTAPMQLEDPEIRKLLHSVTIYMHLEGNQNISMLPIYDFDNSLTTMQPMPVIVPIVTNLAVYGTMVYGEFEYGVSNILFRARTNIQGSGQIVQLQFSTDDTNAPYSIQGISLQYRPLGRR